MFPKMGKKLPHDRYEAGNESELRQAIAVALKTELGTTHQAIKTVMRWTGASERTVKHWFAGSHSPGIHNLAAIARHSDMVLECFLLAADHPRLLAGVRLNSIRPRLVALLNVIDADGAYRDIGSSC